MNKLRLTKLIAAILLFNSAAFGQETIITAFDEILFYDGYAQPVQFPTPAGVIRHSNDLYARKLSNAEVLSIGSTLTLDIVVKAVCDNYDRIGSANLAFVPKGATSYIPADVDHIELGRFITPFMNKNMQPDTVPYTFSIDNIARILKDEAIFAQYDFWVELAIFGVPYAANNEVAGCANRNDVFYGTMKLTTNTDASPTNELFIPLNFKKNLNNYEAGASDNIGVSTRTINFTVPQDLYNAKFVLISSNHGSNSGGEEYNRRIHNVSFDGNQILTFIPGENSCEPYRVFNTQGNGIYGPSPRTDSQWQSFSNWCPGAKIPTRETSVGNISAGNHTWKIEIPDAVFAAGQGNIPISLFIQGSKDNVGVNENEIYPTVIAPNPSNEKFEIKGVGISNAEVKVIDFTGKIVCSNKIVVNENVVEINTQDLQSGMYYVLVNMDEKQSKTKIVVRH